MAAADIKPVGSYPNSGIDVVIVGTGLGGLSAALEFTRKGHNVTVLERNATINTAGDMYFMGRSATHWFKHYPEMQAEFERISLEDAYIETFKYSGDQIVAPSMVRKRFAAAGLDPNTPPGSFQMRPLVYKMFVNQVTKLGINVIYNQRVVDYQEDATRGRAWAVTDDGTKYEADLVVAADGIGSKSQGIVGGEPRAISSGRAMWRAAFPIENLDKNPEVKEFFAMIDGKHPIIRTWLGPGTYALTLTRPDTMIWILNHDSTGSSSENWNSTIDKSEVLEGMDSMFPEHMPKWAPVFKELVNCTPDNTIVNFDLLWRNPQQSWTSPARRVVQLGDAAHCFLPASGSGATQATEDSVTLASCLQLAGKENIDDALKVYLRFRFIRTACAQKLGFSNAELLQDADWSKVKVDPKRAAPRLPKWIWKHNPEEYTYQYFEKALEAIKKGVDMADDDSIPPNYPEGYHYEKWDIGDIMEDIRAGREVQLGEGDWA